VLVVFDRRLARLSTRATAAYPFVFQNFSEPVSVIATFSEQPFDVWQAAEQCPCAGIFADRSGGDEQIDSSYPTVTDCVQLGVHATFGATD